MYFPSYDALADFLAENPGLKSLQIDYSPQLSKLPQLPEGLKLLILRHLPALTELPNLPQSLTSLTIENCRHLSMIPPFPGGLRLLHLNKCPIQFLPRLPGGVLDLKLHDLAPDFDAQPFPADLFKLSIRGWKSNIRFPRLPAKLSVLGIYDCDIIKVPSLPAELGILTVEDCPLLVDFESGFGERFHALWLTNCGILRHCPPFPKSLQFVTTRGCNEIRFDKKKHPQAFTK